MSEATESAEVRDDRPLLERMLADMSRAESVWRPQARWFGYADRIARELRANGLRQFRRNYHLLKGFAIGGVPEPQPPASGIRQAAFAALHRLPGSASILADYRRLLGGTYRQLRDLETVHARTALDRLAAEFPNLRIPAGLGNGGSDRAFPWRGHVVAADWLPYLARAADLYRRTPPERIDSVLEIGPGLCHSTLAHLALNPHCRVIVNVDIPPILYIGTQFLKSIPDVEVVDYTAAEKGPTIEPQPGERPRIYQIAPWQLPKVVGRFAIMLNAASFQEMTPEICKAYAAEAKRLVRSHVMLHCADPRLEHSAGPWKETTIPASRLVGLFSDVFPAVEVIDDGWCEDFVSRGYRAVLLSAAS